MKRISSITIGIIVAAVVASLPFASFAQTNMTMPTLFDQSGNPVNNMNTTPLSAGYYYLAPGGMANQQVYYYGNGTYYDGNTGMYGGSVNNPKGTAGVSLGYSSGAVTQYGNNTNMSSSNTSTPGVPNTGSGGDSMFTWIALTLSGLVVASGTAYLVMNYKTSNDA